MPPSAAPPARPPPARGARRCPPAGRRPTGARQTRRAARLDAARASPCLRPHSAPRIDGPHVSRGSRTPGGAARPAVGSAARSRRRRDRWSRAPSVVRRARPVPVAGPRGAVSAERRGRRRRERRAGGAADGSGGGAAARGAGAGAGDAGPVRSSWAGPAQPAAAAPRARHSPPRGACRRSDGVAPERAARQPRPAACRPCGRRERRCGAIASRRVARRRAGHPPGAGADVPRAPRRKRRRPRVDRRSPRRGGRDPRRARPAAATGGEPVEPRQRRRRRSWRRRRRGPGPRA